MNKDSKYCELNPDVECTNCNKCNVCDLDSGKLCDNCGKCIGLEDADYGEIEIEGILDNEYEVEDYICDKKELDRLHRMDSSLSKERAGDYDFIEDIPELREKFNK